MPPNECKLVNSVDGQACMIVSNGNWRRGSVISRPEAGVIKVLSADFGVEELIRITNVKTITPEFLAIPLVLLSCSMYGVECGGINAEEFKNSTFNKELVIEIVGKNTFFDVILHDVTGEEDININNALMSLEKERISSQRPRRDPKPIDRLIVGGR